MLISQFSFIIFVENLTLYAVTARIPFLSSSADTTTLSCFSIRPFTATNSPLVVVLSRTRTWLIRSSLCRPVDAISNRARIGWN